MSDLDPKVASIFDEALGLAEEAVTTQQKAEAELTGMQTKLAELQTQLAAKDKVILEKVAEATKLVLSDEAVNQTLDHLAGLGLLNQAARVKVAAELKASPDAALALTTKVAELMMNAASGGTGIDNEKSASDNHDPDPDGWGAFAAGHTVRVKR